MGVALANKIIQVQLHNSIAHHWCSVVCLPPWSLCPSPFIFPTPSSLFFYSYSWQSPYPCLCPWIFSFLYFFLFNLFTTPHPNSGQSPYNLCVCLYFLVRSFWSLDSLLSFSLYFYFFCKVSEDIYIHPVLYPWRVQFIHKTPKIHFLLWHHILYRLIISVYFLRYLNFHIQHLKWVKYNFMICS